MNVLVIGSGGREHALVWKLASDPRVFRVIAAPGSDAISATADCFDVAVDDVDGMVELAKRERVDLTVVGPEAPLAAGLVDRFQTEGLRVFGPDKRGAELESSKIFMKSVLDDAAVPTARYQAFTEAEPARAFARELGFPVVVKADGLAAGKGVIICAEDSEADEAIDGMLEGGAFGEAGKKIVVEEFLDGEEVSYIALCDGKDFIALAPSQDHKAVFDGDQGPNTGGMGAYSPPPIVTPELEEKIKTDIIRPTVDTLRAKDIDFRGVLYAGLMIVDGEPKVLEYNVRFGDPECQPLMMRLKSSLLDLIEACLDGGAAAVEAEWYDEAAVCVVLASGGYPGDYQKGSLISGLGEAGKVEGVQVFHAGTVRADEGWQTAGGRVLGVTAIAPDTAGAVENAYRAVEMISWPGLHFRKDIARRAL